MHQPMTQRPSRPRVGRCAKGLAKPALRAAPTMVRWGTKYVDRRTPRASWKRVEVATPLRTGDFSMGRCGAAQPYAERLSANAAKRPAAKPAKTLSFAGAGPWQLAISQGGIATAAALSSPPVLNRLALGDNGLTAFPIRPSARKTEPTCRSNRFD